MKKNVKVNLKKMGLSLVLWILIWQFGAMAVGNSLFLPKPLEAAQALFALLQTKTYYVDLAATLFRTTAGIVLSFVVGLALSFLAYRYKAVEDVLSLPVSLLKSIPVMAIIIYALILLSSDLVPIFVCFLMCFPICYINLLSGLKSIDGELLEMAKVFEIRRSTYYKKILLPSLGPQIRASLDLVAGLSWKAVVSAEVLSIPDWGMGFNLMDAKYYLETDKLFAWVISIVVFSYIYERILKFMTTFLEYRSYEKSKISLANSIEEVRQPRGGKIVLEGIKKSFGDKQVLDNINLSFDPNERTSIVAPSGYGKTTILRLIAGLESQDGGSISMDEGCKLSYLFQEDRLIPWLNIYDNLAIVLADKLPEAESKKRIEKILKIMELDGDFHKLPSQLSGGMRHRAALARAFIYPADVLLLDEPFKGLDLPLIDRIIDGAWVRTTKDKTVVFSSHIPEISRRLADRIIEL